MTMMSGMVLDTHAQVCLIKSCNTEQGYTETVRMADFDDILIFEDTLENSNDEPYILD